MFVATHAPGHRPTTIVGSTVRRRSAALVLVAFVALVVPACGGRSDPGAAIDVGGATVTPAVATGPASVVSTTVAAGAAADGSWRASGLARNDSGSPAGGLQVTATLTGADGRTLGRFETTSPVAPVRAGEQVPFSVTAPGIAAMDAASVQWSATATSGSSDAAGRDLEVAVYWTRAYGDGHVLDLPSFRDPAGGTHPLVLFASLTNASTAPVGRSTLVVAWTSPDGRVVAVATGQGTDPSGGSLDSIIAGGSADVLVLVDDPVQGPALDGLTPSTWSAAR